MDCHDPQKEKNKLSSVNQRHTDISSKNYHAQQVTIATYCQHIPMEVWWSLYTETFCTLMKKLFDKTFSNFFSKWVENHKLSYMTKGISPDVDSVSILRLTPASYLWNCCFIECQNVTLSWSTSGSTVQVGHVSLCNRSQWCQQLSHKLTCKI